MTMSISAIMGVTYKFLKNALTESRDEKQQDQYIEAISQEEGELCDLDLREV
jgi:hypothetical protein